MSLTTDIGALITSSPEIHNGRARIAGTGVTVHRIVRWYKVGLTPEEIAHKFGHISLAQVHAALAYNHANQSQIEGEIAHSNAEAERIEREHVARMKP